MTWSYMKNVLHKLLGWKPVGIKEWVYWGQRKKKNCFKYNIKLYLFVPEQIAAGDILKQQL